MGLIGLFTDYFKLYYFKNNKDFINKLKKIFFSKCSGHGSTILIRVDF